MGEAYAQRLVGAGLEADAVLPARNSLPRMKRCPGVSQSRAHHRNTLTAEMSAELTAAGEVAVVVAAAVEMGNTAAVAAVAADKAPSGRMLTTKQETRELAVSDLGIRSHHLNHGDHQM